MGLFDHFSRDKNEFFNHQQEYAQEKFMYSLLNTEIVLKFGILCKYFVIDYNKDHNPIFGEDEKPITNITPDEYSFTVKAMPTELPKEDTEWGSFGQDSTESMKLFIPIEHFRRMSLVFDKDAHKPKIGDLIKTEYNDFFLEVTFVTTSSSDEKFLQSSHTYELSVRKMVIDESIESVVDGFGMDELVDMFNTNSSKLDISDKIDEMKNGTDNELGKDTFPTSGKGKNKVLYDPKITEKDSRFKNEGW